ncbi:MAG: LPS export ABC transporter periplasmic protein LptC [Gloeobacterales cyanobacterium]
MAQMRHALFCVGLALWLSACTQAPPPPAKPDPGRASLTYENIILTESDRITQGPLWEIKAKRAEYSKDRKIAQITSLEGTFFDAGKKALRVKAPTGEIRTDERTILLKGGVQGLSLERGTTLNADQIRWTPEKKIVTAEGSVVLFDPKQQVEVTGKRMVGDIAIKSVTLNGGVTATSKSRQSKLLCDKAIWQIPEKILKAIGNVVYTQSKPDVVSIQAGQASWNMNKDELIALEGVQYQSADLNVQGNSGTALLKDRKVKIQGNVLSRIAEAESP